MKDIHPLYEALSLFERAHLPGGPVDGEGVSRVFTVSSPWGVRSDFLRRKALRPGGRGAAIPGLQAKHLLPLCLSSARLRLILPVTAEAFQLKADMSRLRAFYLPTAQRPALCVKIVAAGGKDSGRTANEIQRRQAAERLGTLSMPRIQSHGPIGDYMFIAEEMIPGRRFSLRRDAGLFTRQILPELVETYRAAGIRAEGIADHFSPDLPRDLLHAAGDGEEIARRMASMLEDAFSARCAVDVSLCHGDLVPSNLCAAQGKIYFLDWDMSGYGPIVPDVLRLALKNPGRAAPLLRAACEALRPVARENPLPAFTAAMARRIVNMPGQKKALLTLWAQNYPSWDKV